MCVCMNVYKGGSRMPPNTPLYQLFSIWLSVWGCKLLTPRDSLWLHIFSVLITFYYYGYRSCGYNPTLISALGSGTVVMLARISISPGFSCCRLWVMVETWESPSSGIRRNTPPPKGGSCEKIPPEKTRIPRNPEESCQEWKTES
jgi:hypothetical protein